MITLRPGRPKDLENILSWRNADCAVRYSKSGRALTREEAVNAYYKALNGVDPLRRVLMICLERVTSIGYVRFDFHENRGTRTDFAVKNNLFLSMRVPKAFGTKLESKFGTCPPIFEQAEISIALDPVFQGKGYGSEALKKGCAYAFEHFGLKKITAVVVEKNEASVAAFSKAGFVLTKSDGTFASYELRSV